MTLPAPRFVGPRLPHRRGHRLRRLGPCHHERREASYPPQGGSGSPAEVWKWESGLIYTLDSHIICMVTWMAWFLLEDVGRDPSYIFIPNRANFHFHAMCSSECNHRHHC